MHHYLQERRTTTQDEPTSEQASKRMGCDDESDLKCTNVMSGTFSLLNLNLFDKDWSERRKKGEKTADDRDVGWEHS